MSHPIDPPPGVTHVVYTDGGCHPNPGPGAWAFAIYGRDTRPGFAKPLAAVSGWHSATTNNRMEMTGVIQAIQWFIQNFPSAPLGSLLIITDSQYTMKGATEWAPRWEKSHWQRGGVPVVNTDLWKSLLFWQKASKPVWYHVRGHRGIPGNELCDQMCTLAMQDKKGVRSWK